jgi:hypothetical protein
MGQPMMEMTVHTQPNGGLSRLYLLYSFDPARPCRHFHSSSLLDVEAYSLTQLFPRPPASSELHRMARHGPSICVNSSFNLAASSFPFPLFPLQFLLLFSIFLGHVDAVLLVNAANVAAIRPPNVDHHLHPRSHFHPCHSPNHSFPVAQVSLPSSIRQVHPFSSRSESAGGCGGYRWPMY